MVAQFVYGLVSELVSGSVGCLVKIFQGSLRKFMGILLRIAKIPHLMISARSWKQVSIFNFLRPCKTLKEHVRLFIVRVIYGNI